MEKRQTRHILTELLYLAVNGEENGFDIRNKLTRENVASVYRLAKNHDMAHVLSRVVYRSGIELDEEIGARLKEEEILAEYRYERMKFSFEEICRVFEEASIAYIPLKGSVIRPYYPYESMRTSCDVDILVREEDIPNAVKALTEKGYTRGERGYHDVSLYSPNGVHLELHFKILENMNKVDGVLKDAWKYAVPTSGFRYDFTNEFFAFYLFAHMAYHFLMGGCGIRSLVDVWIMEHKMGISYSCASELLKKAGIYRFASEMSKIADLCFTLNAQDEFSDSVIEYIFQGGVYGNAENHIAVDKTKAGGSLGYVLRRLFMPYKSMKILFPVLERAPYLLPFCWIVRWINAIFGGKAKRIKSEMARLNGLSDEKLKKAEDVCSHLGL